MHYLGISSESIQIDIITDDNNIQREIDRTVVTNMKFIKPEPAPKRIPDKRGFGGVFKERALKDALDILVMSRGEPFIFTYSSNFGALALQLMQVRQNFCSNWASLDWGKREWPPIGTIGIGGIRGVKKNASVTSALCDIQEEREAEVDNSYCSILLRKSKLIIHGAQIISLCMCDYPFSK